MQLLDAIYYVIVWRKPVKNYNIYEEPELLPVEAINKGIYRLVFCEWRNGREELLSIDDRNDPPHCLQNYNKTWRLWTNVPTREMRDAAPWREDEN